MLSPCVQVDGERMGMCVFWWGDEYEYYGDEQQVSLPARRCAFGLWVCTYGLCCVARAARMCHYAPLQTPWSGGRVSLLVQPAESLLVLWFHSCVQTNAAVRNTYASEVKIDLRVQGIENPIRMKYTYVPSKAYAALLACMGVYVCTGGMDT